MTVGPTPPGVGPDHIRRPLTLARWLPAEALTEPFGRHGSGMSLLAAASVIRLKINHK